MKKKALVFIVASLFLVGCSGTEVSNKEVSTKIESKTLGEVVNFVYDDIKGDDNGPGNYTYPTAKVMVPGAFDLLQFSLTEDGEDYVFQFTVDAQIKNDYGSDDAWDIQLFDVYINTGEGKYTHTVAGRHVKIAEGWDLGFVVAPNGPLTSKYELKKSLKHSVDDVTPAENFLADMDIPDSRETSGNTITARIAKSKMGDLSKIKGIQVFSSSFEGITKPENANIRYVNEFEAQWVIGGGTDYLGDPNVMDILGDNSELGNYVSEEGETVYPTINLIKIEN